MMFLTIHHQRGTARYCERSLEPSLDQAIAQGRFVLDTEPTARRFEVDESWPTEYCPETITRYRETSWRAPT